MAFPFQTKRNIFFIFTILGLALLLRALYFNDYRKTEIYPLLVDSDGYSYAIWAKDIASGDTQRSSKAFMKWPLYAYFLAILFKISGDNIAVVYLLQFVLGALNCVLIYYIAKIIFNEVIGFIAALFCIWYGLFIFYDGLLIYTSLSLFLNSLLFLFILHIQSRLNKKRLFLLGIFLGICALLQGNIIIFGISAVSWILWQKRLNFHHPIRNFLSFILGLFIVIGAVTLRNYRAEKDFVPIQGNLGVNFFLGNNAEASGAFHNYKYFDGNQENMFRDAKIIAEGETGRKLKTSEVSYFWFNKAVDFIKHNPFAYFKLLFKKIAYLFNPMEQIHDSEYKAILYRIKIFKLISLDLGFILPLGFLGMLLNLKRFKETALLYIMLGSISLSIIVFFVTTRYRIAMVPFMAIFASSAVFSIWEAARKRRYLKFGLLCVTLAFIFTLLNYNIPNRPKISDNILFSYYFNEAKYYLAKSDYPEAIRQLHEADLLQPHNHYVSFFLGTIYYQMKDFKLSEAKFKEAIGIFPYYVAAYFNLGFLYNQQQRFGEAKEMLERAVFLDPEYIRAHMELGKTYKAMGDVQRAKQELKLALKNINRWRIEERAIIEKELGSLVK